MITMRIITRKDVPEYEKLDTKNSKNLITAEIVDKAKVTDTKSGAFVIEKSVVIKSEVNAKEYIQSFKDDVGIEAVMRQFGLTGDPSVFDQRKLPTMPVDENGYEPIQDYTGVPANQEEAYAIAATARSAFKSLPPELVNNRSFMEFAETCTDQEIAAYIEAYNKAHSSEGGN